MRDVSSIVWRRRHRIQNFVIDLGRLPRRVGSLYDADATPFGYVFAKPGANKTRAEIK